MNKQTGLIVSGEDQGHLDSPLYAPEYVAFYIMPYQPYATLTEVVAWVPTTKDGQQSIVAHVPDPENPSHTIPADLFNADHEFILVRVCRPVMYEGGAMALLQNYIESGKQLALEKLQIQPQQVVGDQRYAQYVLNEEDAE